jgi:capsular polysaccharide transport system permease protein
MQKSKNSLLAFQNKNNVLDPAEQAKAMSGIITALESTLANLEAELANMHTYLHDTAPQIITLKSKIAAVKGQIAKEKAILAGEGNNQLNKLAAQYMDVKQMVEFNMDVYKANLAALEKSRLDASKKIKTVVTIAAPHIPDEAEYPRKIYVLTLIFIINITAYGIIKLIIAMLKEHSEDAF